MQLVAILTWKRLVRAECQLHLMQTQRLQKKGFSNWKNAMEKKKRFQKRESSDWHNYGGTCKICDGTRNSNR